MLFDVPDRNGKRLVVTLEIISNSSNGKKILKKGKKGERKARG